MTIQQRQRLLNDTIAVYKRNFNAEINNVSADQVDLASSIGGMAKKIQNQFNQRGRYYGGLTAVTLESKMNKESWF